MGSRMELFLSGYFRVLALTCSAQKSTLQRLLSSYLALVLADMVRQMWRYFEHNWVMNEMNRQHHRHFGTYAKIIDALSMAYLLAHMLMVLQALLLRNRERRLLAQLPDVGVPSSTCFKLRLHVALECLIVACALTRAAFLASQGQLLANLRELYTTQAVRARYLQMSLMVVRIDVKLLALQQQLHGRSSSFELRTNYAHIVRLTRQVSRLYGLSVLLMNVLCIGDFIVVCYAYIILWRLTTMNISWLLLWQTVYVVLPTIIKIWTLCAVCDSCVQRSRQLLVLINGAWRRQLANGSANGNGNGNRIRARKAIARKHTEDFSLQIMQNSVQFEVCGIYHLNLKTLAGMFFFIIDSLVIFLQFIGLTQPQRN